MTENIRNENSILGYVEKPQRGGGKVEISLDKDEVEQLYERGELTTIGANQELVFIKVNTHCHVCNNSGALLTWNCKTDRFEIQKCDACRRFTSDYLAWVALEPLPNVEDIDEYIEDMNADLLDDDLWKVSDFDN